MYCFKAVTQEDSMTFFYLMNDKDVENLKKLGKRMKELRLKKGYTNYENFALDHDIHRAQYSKYEMGENMKFLSLLKVIDGLGITVEEFFKGWDD